jgi:2-oxoacid:acceptor oxidoreductase delta subunit (pyruvate/2-ketoisovalerate family)
MVLAPVANVPSANIKTSSWRDSKPVIDYDKCTRCGICWKFCPDVAIDLVASQDLHAPNERFAKLEAPVINYDHCKGCGICATECPFDAIEMVREEAIE